MKNSVPIPSDVWEEKKALIAALYKDEEWPLKQVIKKIRSENFNPSETQLRSRLKKWRVTKPSRQTRKKSHEPSTKDTVRETSSPKEHSNHNSPKPKVRARPLPTATKAPATELEWYMTNKPYEPNGLPTATPFGGHEVPTTWPPATSHPSPMSSPTKSRVSSHASLAISTASYESSQISPLVDGALLNPTPAMTPTYTDPSYSLNAESCMQTPVSTAAAGQPIQWTMPQWYSMPMDANSRAPPLPFYTTGPLTPPIDPMMHLMGPHVSQHMPDFQEDIRSWNRTVSSPYSPEVPAPTSQKIRQPPKPLDRKMSLPSKINTGQSPSGIVTPTSPYFPHGQHSAVCSPGYTYPGPEAVVHRASIDFR